MSKVGSWWKETIEERGIKTENIGKPEYHTETREMRRGKIKRKKKERKKNTQKR